MSQTVLDMLGFNCNEVVLATLPRWTDPEASHPFLLQHHEGKQIQVRHQLQSHNHMVRTVVDTVCEDLNASTIFNNGRSCGCEVAQD